ncbi:hypothetical protein [Rhodococcus spelaei]|uniref:hypothetical protein n=1 Tax=Rhodococcus spelaei TaxID=2546320 RepID=UPI0015EEBA41|nr:hypothetical protein [Rhodococcus spelaei]
MAEGKTSREAMRRLKPQVAKKLWRTMRDDYQLSRELADLDPNPAAKFRAQLG